MQIFTPFAGFSPKQTTSNSPSSPIEYIPNEILIRIMHLTVPNPNLPVDALSAAVKLSHVSQHFRSVAHNTSELWTVVCPKFPLLDDQVLFWLDVLARSRERLIDIVVNAEVELQGVVQPYRTFLGAVVGHSNRWRKFEITSKTWEPIELFLDQSQCLVLLPRLEELTLHHSDDPGRTVNREGENLTPRLHNFLFGEDAVTPMLKIVKLGATYFNYSHMRSLVKDLSELHFENHTYPRTSDAPEMIIDMLRASPRLQVLTFASLDVKFNNWLQPVELHHLKRLEFRGNPRNAENLFPLLRVPSLEVIRLGECRFAAEKAVTMPVYVADETMRILINSFTGLANDRRYWKAGGLKELSLEYDHCLPRDLERLLRLTPNVETFRVYSSEIFPVFTNNPRILPNLRHWVVKSSIFCALHPFSAILTDRPGVTLSVEGDLAQDSEHLYNTLKDTHNITLRA